MMHAISAGNPFWGQGSVLPWFGWKRCKKSNHPYCATPGSQQPLSRTCCPSLCYSYIAVPCTAPQRLRCRRLRPCDRSRLQLREQPLPRLRLMASWRLMSGGPNLDYNLTRSASHQRSRCRRLRPCERSRLRLRERSLLRLRRLCLELLGRSLSLSLCLCPSLLAHVQMGLAHLDSLKLLLRMSSGLEDAADVPVSLNLPWVIGNWHREGVNWGLGTPVTALAAIQVII